VVLVVVRDAKGLTRRGIALRLLDKKGGRLLDRTTTNEAGVALLRFPRPDHEPADHAGHNGSGAAGIGPADVKGFVDVAGSNAGDAVTIPAGVQHVVTEIELPHLPALETVTDPETGEEVEVVPPGDDLLSRLPTDFSTGLCEAISQLAPATPDSLFAKLPGVDPDDFRTKRYPIVKRLSITKIGDPPASASASSAPRPLPPRRFLVRLRQEWKFLNMTLGELTEVGNLDPGAILRETTETATRTVDEVSHQAQEVISTAISQVRSLLNRLQTLDQLVETTTSQVTDLTSKAIPNPAYNPNLGVSVNGGVSGSGGAGAVVGAAIGAGIGGLAGPLGAAAGAFIGGLFGGGGTSASAGVNVTLPNVSVPSTISNGTTTTVNGLLNTKDQLDASMTVNQLVNTATDQTNRLVRDAVETLRQLESLSGRAADRVSPLLSRVTNLLRWTIYQNYLVCSHVEDVLEIRELRITEPSSWPAGDLFSDEDIVEYRPFFAPALLRPELLPQFEILARETQREARVVTQLLVEVGLDVPSLPIGYLSRQVGVLRATAANGSTAVVPLHPGQPFAAFTLDVPPARPGEPIEIRLALDCSQLMGALDHLPAIFGKPNLRVVVRHLRVRFGGITQDVDENLGGALVATLDEPQPNMTRSYPIPGAPAPSTPNPLSVHINRNRAYYFGLLIQAALALPSLRDDAPQLDQFASDHPIWRMPVVGVEGDKIFVLADPDPDDPAVLKIKADPGAATLVQLAAPGAYAEALQGLLSLTDALGQIHPALKQLPAPTMPPLAIMDLTGKQLEVVDDVAPIP
jgi:hypothetical protein